MNDLTPLAMIALLGGVAWWVLRPRQEQLRPDRGVLGDALGDAISVGLEEAQTSIQNLRDENSAERDGLRQLGQQLRTLFTGRESSSRRNQRQIAELQAGQKTELFAMEEWIQQLHVTLSDSAVERWRIRADGTWEVIYRGRRDPFLVRPPTTALYPLAWSVELPVRVFGSVARLGSGPIGTRLVFTETPAFSDRNPYAPLALRRTRYTISEEELRERFLAENPDSATPNSPAQSIRNREPLLSLGGLEIL